ncbi:hypothetical protein [Bradyrhizobium sp. CCGUVB23]|uniref:hypothetical protein n=1 Tax=Bradyrhizobium sp. CCGUVB23 TaxID=2949630 RepID=UPI0020B2C075|nr:hypothetical protein [Bradyrhizobium sp. CCGUVB23]MCP3460718.1 hypothetical protein [Bradyrhizobium sp. CCGUVB23]
MRVAARLFFAGCLSMAPGVARADAVEDYYALLQEYFKGSHWIPIIIPRGEQIGNVYNIRNLQFVADGKTCFPKLKVPAPTASTVPDAAKGKKINGALALGVKDVAAAEAQLGKSDEMSLQFTDPHVLAVSAVTLANSFNSAKCRFLKSQVEATLSGQSLTGETANLVVGEILFAKRSLVMSYADGAKATAEVSNWQRFIKLIGLTASASVDAQSGRSISVTTSELLPVAIRPAFIPDKFPDVRLGYDKQNTAVRWTPLNMDTQTDQHRVNDLAEKLKDSLPRANNLKSF